MFGPAGPPLRLLHVWDALLRQHRLRPGGDGIAVLLRAGEVVEGADLAGVRRPTSKSAVDLASGPARLATTLALTTADSGRDALTEPFELRLPPVPADRIQFRTPGGRLRRRRLHCLSVAFLAAGGSHGVPL